MSTTPLLTIAPGSSSAPSDFSSSLYLFLDKLSPAMVGRLYEAPASCLSIFRYVSIFAVNSSRGQSTVRRKGADERLVEQVAARDGEARRAQRAVV